MKKEELKQLLLKKPLTIQILEDMYFLGGKSGLFKNSELQELLQKQGFSKNSIINTLKDLEENHLLNSERVEKNKYYFFTNRSLRHITDTKTVVNMPLSKYSFDVWNLKYKYVKTQAESQNTEILKFIKHFKYNTVFNSDNKTIKQFYKFGATEQEINDFFKYAQNFNLCFSVFKETKGFTYLMFLENNNKQKNLTLLEKNLKNIIDRIKYISEKLHKNKNNIRLVIIMDKKDKEQWENQLLKTSIKLNNLIDIQQMDKFFIEFKYV